MRPARLVNLLMLLLIAFTASGVGRVWHERLAHAAHDRVVQATPAEDLHDDPPPAHPHAHTDCELCVMLSSLTAILLTAAAFLLVGRVIHWTCRRVTQLPRRFVDLPALPSRGPPALA